MANINNSTFTYYKAKKHFHENYDFIQCYIVSQIKLGIVVESVKV